MAESEAEKVQTSFIRTPSRNRSIALWAVALLTIALGFADLARGGTTIAPVLLVLGYCVLVPIAILK
jgi:hypothetical protein